MARPRMITGEQKLLIALLCSERKMTHAAIAEREGVSPSAVAKIVKECFENHRLRLVFNRDGLTPDELSSLHLRANGVGDLKAMLAQTERAPDAVVIDPDIRIFDSGSTEVSPAGWAARLDVFGRAVAPHIATLMTRAKVAGTSWGETLAAVARGLKAEQLSPRKKKPIEFFGFCGEMLEGPPRKTSSSSLARQFDEIFNQDSSQTHSYWLAGVPSRMPTPASSGLTLTECDAVTRYVRNLPGYRKVFGSPDGAKAPRAERPLVDRANLILTSCGPKERPLGYGGVQELQVEGLTLREAKSRLVGDIAGFLLNNPLIADPGNRIAAINSRLACPHLLDKLRACSRRSLQEGTGGTIVCAIGDNKVDTVVELVRLGVAASYLIDMDLANGIMNRLGSPSSARKRAASF